MQLLSLKNEGKLYYEGVEDSFEEELALDLDEDIDNVTVTVSYLQKCGLLEVISKDQYLLTEVPAVTGSESASAERVRKHRAQKELIEQMSETKALQCNTGVTEGNAEVTNCNTEKEIEKEIEKRDRDINIPVRSSDKHPSEPEADVEALILNDGSEWRPTEALFAEYVRLYPSVDVKQQFNEMRAWCISNQTKRKTRRGITKFVNSWLSREQDKGNRRYGGQSQSPMEQWANNVRGWASNDN